MNGPDMEEAYEALAWECGRLAGELKSAAKERDRAWAIINEIRNLPGGGRMFNRAEAIVDARATFRVKP